MKKTKKYLVFLRRGVQTASLLLLVYIVWNTRFPLKGFVSPEIYFKIDPLVMIATAVAERVWLTGLVYALATLAFTFLLGRFFCGWLCPLGGLIDLTGALQAYVRKKAKRPVKESAPSRLSLIKYGVLGVVIFFSFLGIQLAWVLDPITITVRALSFNIHPGLNALADGIFRQLLVLTSFWEPLDRFYNFVRGEFLSESLPKFPHTGVIFAIFIVILLVSLIKRRFWCRFFCPLGAFLALPSRFTLFQRRVRDCGPSCRSCKNLCRMNAINEDNSYKKEECVLCLDCIAFCVNQKATFSFINNPPLSDTREKESPDGLTRARFIVLSTAALSSAVVKPARAAADAPPPLRPPGALAESKFVQRCIRCGNCIKVCPTNVLQPSRIGGGLEGLWTPRLEPEIGYCEYECNLCGRVCPTAAIENLQVGRKKQFKIGIAAIDKKICLPWAKGENCIVCEEHCPIPEKAIKLKPQKSGSALLKLPVIDEELCIGCAICTFKCPTRPKRAVTVHPRPKKEQ